MGEIINRDSFLGSLAKKLGRKPLTAPEPLPAWSVDYPATRLTDKTQPELFQEFLSYATSLGIKLEVTSEADLAQTILKAVQELDGGPVILNDDKRLLDTEIVNLLTNLYQAENVKVWDYQQTEQDNIDFAAKANVGIVFAEHGVTESGGIILESDKHYGRSVSLLPKYSIVVFRASTVLPSVHQYAEKADARAQRGERTPSVINIISGPSSTADIELIKVVGVHGPVGLAYVIINDLV